MQRESSLWNPHTHLHLITVEEVDVGSVLVLVLTHQQQHGRVPSLVQDCLTHVDDREREVLQLLLQGGQRWQHLETNLHPHSSLPICLLGSHSSKHKICDQMWRPTSVSQSSSLTALSVTCRSISWVQILSLESSRISFLMASSTVVIDSVLSMMNVERCCGGNRGSLINI